MAPVTPLPIDERLRVRRPELKLVAMSATLDAEPVAAFLGGAPVVRSEGRTFPLTIEHAAAPDDRQLGKQVSAAVRTLAQQGLDGDVLVFLPGTGENRRCAEDLEDAARTFDLAVVPLHGDLPSDEQDAAVRPGPRRKVILATNGAETSVTIEGVTCVVDSGLARIARHSPWSGVPSLEIEPVSKASCTQRAGRAGRTRPGRVLRRYTKHDFDTRRPFELPEIARADLAGVALELHGAGVHDLRWYETPPAAAWEAGESLLVRLGAVKAGAITALGRRMLQFPVHPRQARIVVEAEGRGVAREACILAALLGARELRLERRGRGEAKLSSPSDLIDDLDALLDARSHGLRADRLRRDGLDIGTAHAVDRAAKQLERIADTRARAPASDLEVDRELVVAVDVGDVGARGQASRVQIRRASAIDAAWLLDLYMDRIEERDELVWNAQKERVERIAQMTYDGLPIDATRAPARGDLRAAELLAKQAIAAGITRFVDADALAQWRARVTLVAKLVPGITPPTDEHLAEVLAAACEGATSFAELRQMGLLALLDASLGDKRALVDRFAPTHVQLGRRRTPIHYELAQPPWVASRMQDFFGRARAPSIGDGRIPLALHLLAPNQRPVQVTTDLPGFWVKHYPALRKQLSRRYPRHPWPEAPPQLVRED